MKRLLALLIIALFATSSARADALPGFAASGSFDEQICQVQIDDVRIFTSAAGDFDPKRPTQLIVYALPNGNSIEQTIGCAEHQGLDWHYFIQQIGAQTRSLRAADSTKNIVIGYVEANVPKIGRSWPTWRAHHPDNSQRVRTIVGTVARQIPGETHIALVAHSGGGAFIFAYINSPDSIDARINRIAFLDANYSYDDTQEHHGDKLLKWLKDDAGHHLAAIAYDDRNIMLDGKPVLQNPLGGTWCASYRMMDRLKQDVALEQSSVGSFDIFGGMNGQIRFFLHRNPDNLILHTRLVGEMNGFMTAMTSGTDGEAAPGEIGNTPQYAKWIAADPISSETVKPQAATKPAPQTQRAIEIPDRSKDALTGSAFIMRVADLARDDRENAILDEIKNGNVPDFMRALVVVNVKYTGEDGIPHLGEFYVTPDYISIGSNDNFVRMPMLPKTAQKIADLFDCSLPTRRMVDQIDAQAALRLEPQPMTLQRESPLVFLEHNCLIEQQRFGRGFGALICGIKKDIVVTNRLQEKPHRVAIYGWRKLDGSPIQPLTIVHGETYVDYSHGVRLIARGMLVDGKTMTIEQVLKDPQLCGLVSDEGVIEKPDYR